jgi:hypothetical protein
MEGSGAYGFVGRNREAVEDAAAVAVHRANGEARPCCRRGARSREVGPGGQVPSAKLLLNCAGSSILWTLFLRAAAGHLAANRVPKKHKFK